MVEVLLNLAKKDCVLQDYWNEEHEKNFHDFKKVFKVTLIMQHPDYKTTFTVYSDVSDYAVGGRLVQKDD